MMLTTIVDPTVLAGMGADELVAHAADHGRRMLRPKAREIITAAADAQCIAPGQRAAAQKILGREVAALERIYDELAVCDHALGTLIDDTPAVVLCTIPGVGVLTASYYGAALGSHHRSSGGDPISSVRNSLALARQSMSGRTVRPASL
jgi:hypothetical protein